MESAKEEMKFLQKEEKELVVRLDLKGERQKLKIF